MTRTPLLLLLIAGCGTPNAIPPGPEDMAMMARSDLGSEAIMDIEGRIIGLDRAGIGGASVSLCQKTCRDTMTDAQGGFAFPGTPVDFYTLRARKPGGDYADLDFPLYLVRGSNPRLLPLVLPKAGPGRDPAQSGPGGFAVDAALTLSLDGNALVTRDNKLVTSLAGVRVPPDLFPNFCVPSARVLAMWAFSPTYLKGKYVVPVRLNESLGLAPGTTVSFIEINPDDGRPSESASGAVSQDGKTIATTMNGGLSRLGWLLVAVISGGP